MQYYLTYLFKYNKIIYNLKAYKVVFQKGMYNDVIKVFSITILNKNYSRGREFLE